MKRRMSINDKFELLEYLRKEAECISEGDVTWLALRYEKKTGRTEMCPFCGKRHLHGEGEGHRVAHCGIDIFGRSISRDTVFKNSKGQIFHLDRGYILVPKHEHS